VTNAGAAWSYMITATLSLSINVLGLSDSGRRHIEANRYATQVRAWRWIELHDERIVAGNDVILIRRGSPQFVETRQHIADMKSSRKWTLARHVFVEMTDVGSEHDKAAACVDADELETG
jgi:hypothetical protein